MNLNNANVYTVTPAAIEATARTVKNVGQQLKHGWSKDEAIQEDSMCIFFNEEKDSHLDNISIEHLEYFYPVVYGSGSMLLKTPMQLLIESEHFQAAEMLLNKGVSLPGYIKEGFFDVNELENYLSYLSQCSYDLFIEYHQLKALESQNKHQEMQALKESKKQKTQFMSGKSNKKAKTTHLLQITANQLLSMIREKHANKMSGKLKEWLDNKMGCNDSLSMRMS